MISAVDSVKVEPSPILGSIKLTRNTPRQTVLEFIARSRGQIAA